MIDDPEHPEMQRAQQQLLSRLGAILGDGTNPLTKPFLDSMFDCVRQHRDEWWARGVDFPVMVALVVPRLGIVEFARADLDVASIRIKIINFVRFNPMVTKEEVVMAFHAAYPDLKPDDVLTHRQEGIDAGERQRERQRGYLEQAEKILKEGNDAELDADDPPSTQEH